VVVQVIEPITIKALSTTDDGLEFNFVLTMIGDCLFRILIAIPVLMKQGDIWKSVRSLDFTRALKLFTVRLMLQGGEMLSSLAVSKLSGSIVKVIEQARIPLVGVLSYFLLCQVLSREQIIYAIAILPLALQFNLLGDGDFNAKDKTGYIYVILAILLLSLSNVVVEALLKKDFGHLRVWDNQFIFALFDFPVMIILYIISVPMDGYPWNPFASSNMAYIHWIIMLSANGAIWGLARLSILAYQDAMWLNLTGVLVIGLVWIAEQFCAVIMETDQDSSQTMIKKALCILSLSCILVGYELNTREQQNKSREE